MNVHLSIIACLGILFVRGLISFFVGFWRLVAQGSCLLTGLFYPKGEPLQDTSEKSKCYKFFSTHAPFRAPQQGPGATQVSIAQHGHLGNKTEGRPTVDSVSSFEALLW